MRLTHYRIHGLLLILCLVTVQICIILLPVTLVVSVQAFAVNSVTETCKRRQYFDCSTTLISNRNVQFGYRDYDRVDVIGAVRMRNDDVTQSSESTAKIDEGMEGRKFDFFSDLVKTLASWSLEDYKWRSDLFKKKEAERNEEEVLAIMRGDTATYVRPMDASEELKGPLGRAEESAVKWLREVFDSEAKRAKQIADGDGDLVRPIDLSDGPLAELEKRAVTFFRSIIDSETERMLLGLIRPMDVEENKRGPLGKAEALAVSKIKDISESEKLRAAQSKLRGGEIVRPIDVPGPLGELEKVFLDIMGAERSRAKEREISGKIIRPKDSKISGPFGNAEREAVAVVDKVRKEEEERFRNIRLVMEENRPMQKSEFSLLGILEKILVGLLRGPQLFLKVIQRVLELLKSEKLEEEDEQLVSPIKNGKLYDERKS